MPAYLISNYKITNPEPFKSYMKAVGATIAAAGGEILVAGPESEAIEGNPDPVTIVVKFSSMDTLRAWYDSPDYQEIIHHRIDNTEGWLQFANQFVVPA